ncbi:MAG: hypothetical protein ABIP88_14125 [Candidatus Binatia bacterium]
MQQRINRFAIAAQQMPEVTTFTAADENTDLSRLTGISRFADRYPGILQRSMHALQPQTLLRIEHLRLPRRESKKRGVELIDV